MSDSTTPPDGSSRRCCCSGGTCRSRIITSETRNSTRHSSRTTKSGTTFTAVHRVCKVGAAVGWLLLMGALLFGPQLYMFYAHGERKAEEKEREENVDERLNSETAIILAATPEQVLLLNDSLVLPTANVTAQTLSIKPVSSVDQDMEALLEQKAVVGTKALRITVLFMNDEPLMVDNSNSTSAKGAICKERQRAMLVTIGDVRRFHNDKVFVQLVLRSPSVVNYANPLPELFNLEALDPVAWGNNRFPSAEEVANFQGMAVCLREGSPLQLVKGWPMRVPEYKEGPWEARVKVERAFVTASAMEKEKKLLLQAVLQILRVPSEGIFNNQNLSTVPFMGYVQAGATKEKHLAGALIRHQLLNKSCKLRREKEKSQVELLCEEVDAKLADLSQMVGERPKLREVFKKTGILAGLSASSFALAVATYLLGAINKSLDIFDIPTCLWGGSLAGVLSLLYGAIAGPITAVKRYNWRQKFGSQKGKFLKKVVKEEESLSSSTAPAVDLVLVVNELERETDEPPDPSQLGISADIRPDPSLIDDPAKSSPVATKVQRLLYKYVYLDTIRAVIEDFKERGFSRFKQLAEENERELVLLRNFLGKAAKMNGQLLSVNENGDFELTARQKIGAYVYFGEQVQRELARDLGASDRLFVGVEALYSKAKTDCMLQKMRTLYKDVKNAGGDPSPIDTTKPLLTSLKQRLRQVKGTEVHFDAELLSLQNETAEKLPPEKEARIKELLLGKAAVQEALDVLSLELRVLYENDLQLTLEEADNLKEKLTSLKEVAGEEPSPQQVADIENTKKNIIKLNQTVASIIYEMRTLGIKVDDIRKITIEVEAIDEET